jgi:hypothetical protein
MEYHNALRRGSLFPYGPGTIPEGQTPDKTGGDPIESRPWHGYLSLMVFVGLAATRSPLVAPTSGFAGRNGNDVFPAGWNKFGASVNNAYIDMGD